MIERGREAVRSSSLCGFGTVKESVHRSLEPMESRKEKRSRMEARFDSKGASHTSESAHMLTSAGRKTTRRESIRARGNFGAPDPSVSLAVEDVTLVVKEIPRHRLEVGESSKGKSVSSSSSGSEERSKIATSFSLARRIVKKDESGNKRPIQIANSKRTAITLPEWPPKVPREPRTRIPRPVSNRFLRPNVGEKNVDGSIVSRPVDKPPRKSEVLQKMPGSNSRALGAGENPTARAAPRSSAKKSPSGSSNGKEAFARELEESTSTGIPKRTSASGFHSNLPSFVREPPALAGKRTEVRPTTKIGNSKRVYSVAQGRSGGPLLSGKEKSTGKSNLSMPASRPTETILASSGRGESEPAAIFSWKLRRPSTATRGTDVKFSSETETAVSGAREIQVTTTVTSRLTSPSGLKALQVPIARSYKEEIPPNGSESYDRKKMAAETLLLLAGVLLEEKLQDDLRLKGGKMHQSPGKSPSSNSACLVLPGEASKSFLLTHPKLRWKASYRRKTIESCI